MQKGDKVTFKNGYSGVVEQHAWAAHIVILVGGDKCDDREVAKVTPKPDKTARKHFFS